MTDTPPANPPTDEEIFRQFRWPAVVVVLLGGHVLLMMIGLAAAVSAPGIVTPPPGYQQGVAWDELQAERRASDKLGWAFAAHPSVMTNERGQRRVVFELTDAAGAAVEGASLRVRVYHHAYAGRAVERDAAPAGPGRFEATLPMPRPGQWRIEAIATRGAERMIAEQDLWIASLEGPAR